MTHSGPNSQAMRRIAVEVANHFYAVCRPCTRVAVLERVKAERWEKDGITQEHRVTSILQAANSIREEKCRRFHAKPKDSQSLARRLDDLKRRRFADAMRKAAFRISQSGNHYSQLSFVEEWGRVRAESESVKAGFYPTGDRRRNSCHRYFAHRLWHSMTVTEGIALLDGMLTLAARRLEVLDGVDVYEAVWVSQGKGFGLNTHRGVIAVVRGPNRSVQASYHEESVGPHGVRKAVRGVQRKRAPKAKKREPQRWFLKAEEIYGQVEVRREHCDSLGLCSSGVAHWCNMAGIDTTKTVRLRDVIRAYRTHPNLDAARLVRHVINVFRSSPPVGASVVFDREGGFQFSLN